MIQNRTRRQRVLRLAVLVAAGGIGCTSTRNTARNEAIQAALQAGLGYYPVRTGTWRASADMSGRACSMPFVKLAESNGLVTVREIPMAYWDSFLMTSTQGSGTVVEVTATQKLARLADSTWSETALGATPPRGLEIMKCGNKGAILNVRTADVALHEIVTEEEYKGELATPGEKHQLVLGVAKVIARPNIADVNRQWADSPKESTDRFRCVVRYDAFKKQWQVVAIDFGVGPDGWGSSYVK